MEKSKTLKEIFTPIEIGTQFIYDPEEQDFFDNSFTIHTYLSEMFSNIFISGKIHDEFGQWIVDALNEKLKKEK